jgi:amino acid transporter
MGITDKTDIEVASDTINDVQDGVIADNKDALKRNLGNRQIQLLAIGGTIGTCESLQL